MDFNKFNLVQDQTIHIGGIIAKCVFCTFAGSTLFLRIFNIVLTLWACTV